MRRFYELPTTIKAPFNSTLEYIRYFRQTTVTKPTQTGSQMDTCTSWKVALKPCVHFDQTQTHTFPERQAFRVHTLPTPLRRTCTEDIFFFSFPSTQLVHLSTYCKSVHASSHHQTCVGCAGLPLAKVCYVVLP